MIHDFNNDSNNAPQEQQLPKVRVAVTHGDTNGVGYELIYKVFGDPAMLELCTPIVYGSAKVGTYHRKAMNLSAPFQIISSAEEAQEGRLNLLSCFDEEVLVEFGKANPEAGHAAFLALERATQDLREGKVDVLVTAPINKSSIQSTNFRFVGHTEYLQDRLGDEETEPLMILFNKLMRVALVTTHVPVSKISEQITQEAIEHKARLLYKSLRRDFCVSAPRIAILGFNPHNGDGGVLGTEEQDVITPAIKQLVEEGIQCFGPYPADGFFGTGQYSRFDGVLAMYHDQGLTPFKALAGDEGVNFTAGLPVVRTSPDHGTAYDIAGKGIASPTSFREAVYAAIDIFRNRQRFDEANANPLPKLYHDRREDERGGHVRTFTPREENVE